MGMLSAALGWDGSHGALENLQQCLLYTLARYVTGDGCIFRFSGNLIDLIDIYDSMLGTVDVVIRSLDNLKKDILHILPHITCFCQCGRIGDSKGDIENFGKCLSQQSLARTGGPDHDDVTLLEFHIILNTGIDAFIVVVYCHRKNFFRFILTDHIIVKKRFHLLWLDEIDSVLIIIILHQIKVVFDDLCADVDTFIADKDSIGSCDQFPHHILGFPAEGAVTRFIIGT